MEHPESDAGPTSAPHHDDESPGMRRRNLLGYAASVPLLSAAAGLGGLAAPSSAQAAILPMTPPDTTDQLDIGDAVTVTALPTMPLVKVSNVGNGRVRLELTECLGDIRRPHPGERFGELGGVTVQEVEQLRRGVLRRRGTHGTVGVSSHFSLDFRSVGYWIPSCSR